VIFGLPTQDSVASLQQIPETPASPASPASPPMLTFSGGATYDSVPHVLSYDRINMFPPPMDDTGKNFAKEDFWDALKLPEELGIPRNPDDDLLEDQLKDLI